MHVGEGKKPLFFKKRLDIQRAQQTVQGHHTERKENTGAKDFLERAWMQTQVSSCCLPAFCCVQKNKNLLSTGILHVSLLHYTQHHDSRWLLGTAKRRAGIREGRVYEVSGFKDVSQKKKKSQLFSRIQVILVCICIYQWVKIYESQGGVFLLHVNNGHLALSQKAVP